MQRDFPEARPLNGEWVTPSDAVAENAGRQMRGQMLWFNNERGDGFIQTDEGERLFVDRSGFLPGLAPTGRCAGKHVSFRREPAGGEHDHHAVGVVLLEELSPRRARLRRPNATTR